ncbi:ABC transporter ATP-binding protein [Apilactobacillus timberlakei]|uniref:ABC transporter ATP-binding protein n=1 Tax=Apilactobacillus timberlakei TaxID=2008380 RepID=UPI0011281DFF|nr:ABC transporter ATP-binding protein [Apilactobacillus timberlakei]TPR18056.1 ABC transporter ATP-binding protein [Apilactobacillus timberlakei]TPR19113.1 ABC transporter ATP-binding protein [Apilactobacillus timberlakei]TPR19858.1 ABC transporter ATP-binding protein [Apilactobacillus timberlakei]TPR21396.1 ABC transporter ATP-binding protein [Apilactobacillus timberlakei]
MQLLETKELTKKFKNYVAVDHLNLTINKGELVALLGHNGAGKSTTISMLIGLIQPTSGNIEFEGLKVNESKYRRKLGVVFQNSVLDNNLTVKQNIDIRANMYKNLDSSFKNKILNDLELSSILNQRYKTLSGGQRRRVDIARSLLNKPEILFLDEPSTGLDIQSRNKIWEFLNNLRKSIGLTIILTTHYLEEAEDADFVYVIDKGKLVEGDTVDNLKNKYAKDTLTLYSDHLKNIKDNLNQKIVEETENSISINPEDHNEAINILSKFKPLITTFEYQRGSMDDIFIALTGKEVK